MTKSSSALAAQNSIEESGHQRPNLIEWAELVVQQFDQTPAAHHYLLLHNLAAVSSGDIDRLMVLMPPGSAKSTYASIVFPVWWLSRHPMSSIIATSHTAGLAERFGRQARDLALERGGALGYTLVGNRPAGGHWQTSKKGEYFATGVRGPLTGRRADLVIIDDPIKSHLEADSPVLRERLWDWYRSDLTTRLKPKGSVVLIMTRWHEDDLGGRLLAQDPDEWRVLRLAALAEGSDPLAREPGEALWPEWEDRTALLRRRATIGERSWSALYQQTPRPDVGTLFRTESIDILDASPMQDGNLQVRAWDLAATAGTGGNDPDWTVGIKVGRTRTGRFIILDIQRFRGTPHDVESCYRGGAHRWQSSSHWLAAGSGPGGQAPGFLSCAPACWISYRNVTGDGRETDPCRSGFVTDRGPQLRHAASLLELRLFGGAAELSIRSERRSGGCSVPCIFNVDRE